MNIRLHGICNKLQVRPKLSERTSPRLAGSVWVSLSILDFRNLALTRILFLHEVGYFEKPIFEMHEFPEYLSERGHHVGFVDFLENSTNNQGPEFGGCRDGRVIPGTKIFHFSQTNGLSGIAKRLWAVVTFPRFFRSVLEQFKPEVVVSFSVPTSGWQALYICRRLGIPYLFRALDVSHKIRQSRLAPFVKLAERYIYRNSDWVSCNNPAMRSYCMSLGARSNHTSVDFPPLDLMHFARADESENSIMDVLDIPRGSTVILYLGSFFYFSGLDYVLRSLSADASGAYLVLVGGGEQEPELRAIAKDLNIEDRVRFAGYVAYHDLPSYLSVADVAINPMLPSLVSDTALPNKVLQYLASGLPVVSTRLTGVSSTFRSSSRLKFVAEPSAVLSAALKLLESPHHVSAGQNEVLQQFSINNAVDRFERQVMSLGKLT